VEQEKTAPEIIAQGRFEAAVVERVLRLIDLSEYKRKQMAPGIKVTSRAFGFGRRMPIAQRFVPQIEAL
jgi:NAD+ synthase (glutamine-hydrolysing)